MNITISQVQLLAPVVEAVYAQQRVRLSDGPREIVGTLRHFAPAKDDVHFLGNLSNLAESWIHITTVQGFEVWVETLFVATQHSEGGCAFGASV